MQHRDEDDVYREALYWAGAYAYAMGKATLYVVALLILVDWLA